MKKNKTFSPFVNIGFESSDIFVWFDTYKGQEISEGPWKSVCQWVGDWTNQGLKRENRIGRVKLVGAMEEWDKAIDTGKDK